MSLSKALQEKQKRISTIHCYEKNVYGRVLIYVEDSKQAKMLAALTGKNTLDYRDIEALETLGFTIDLTELRG